jgi:transposase
MTHASTLFIGLDVHKESIAVAYVAAEREAKVVCPTPAQQIVFQEYVRAVSEQTARLQRVEVELPSLVQTWRWAPVVEAIQAVRGIQFTAAVTLIAGLGDPNRFDTPRQLMSYLGLIPQ